MKSALWDKIGHMALVDLEEPQPKRNEVKLEIAYCGICDNDSQIISGGYPILKPPMTLGHEFTGTVVEVGEDVTTCKPGDRVVANMHSFCGACHYCHNGLEHYCENMGFATGAFAKYVTVAATAITKIPDTMSFELAALAEPLSAAIHGMDLLQMKSGKTVVIYGGNAIAQMYIMLAYRSGASKIICVEPVEEKRLPALKSGANVVVDPAVEDTKAIVLRETNGYGADYVIDVSGKVENCEESVEIAAKCGRLLWCASYDYTARNMSLSLFTLRCEKELSIVTSQQSPYCFDRAVALLGNMDVTALISGIYDLDCLETAVEKAIEGKIIKLLIRP